MTRSTIAISSLSLCSIISTAGPSECSRPKRPPLCRRRIDLASSSDSAGFRPPSGSSSSSSSGSVAIARATSSRLRSPCDSAEAGSSAMSEMPTNSSASIAFASMLFTHSPPRRARGATSGTMTLAMIGRWRKGRMFWNVPAMPRSTTSHGRRAVMSAPRNTMLPASGLRIFVISRSSVVLPAPFGPISPTISSRRTARLIRSTATRPPKRLVSRSTRRSGADMRLEYRVEDKKLLEQMDAELVGWANPAERLHQALEKDEFTLFCQPILALTGAERYPMAEILVRLREEERALLPPGEFLPVFEHYRMMPQLDRWVVFHVVQRLARGARVPRFTINVSGQTLQDPEFTAYVLAATQKYGVANSALLFEIDESDVLARLEVATRFANAVKTLGCGVVIDGFGRRAVSFTPLKALRV